MSSYLSFNFISLYIASAIVPVKSRLSLFIPLITTLVDQKLYSVNLASKELTQKHVFDDISGRLRDVYVTVNGEVAVLTDGKGARLLILSSK